MTARAARCTVTVGLAAGLVAASLGGPITWTPSRPLNTNAAADGAVGDYYPHLAGDGAGNWVCVWCATVPTAPSPRDFDIWVARSSDDGDTWSDPARLDPFADAPPEIESGDDFDPRVYTDGAGRWLATWYTWDTRGGTIEEDIDLLISRSDDNGVTWTSAQPLNADAAYDLSLYGYASESTGDLVYGGEGRWVVVWHRYLVSGAECDLWIAHSTDGGVNWTLPVLFHPSMETDSGDDWSPRLACDRAGHWLCVWGSDDSAGGTLGNEGDLRVSRSADGYAWSDPLPLNHDAAFDGISDEDKSPRIVRGPDGRWLVAWYRGLYNVLDDDILYAYSDDNGLSWSDAAYLNTNATSDVGNDRRPTLATDGRGRWVCAWYSRDTLGLPIMSDNVFFSFSCDNGATWTAPGVVNHYALWMDAEYDWNPEAASGLDGRWMTVWYSKYNLDGIGADWDIMYTTANAPPRPGDQDCDGDTDLLDVAGLQPCFGAGPPLGWPGIRFDVDDNGAVDWNDFEAIAAVLYGPAPG